MAVSQAPPRMVLSSVLIIAGTLNTQLLLVGITQSSMPAREWSSFRRPSSVSNLIDFALVTTFVS
ncbi:hypothetical protein BDR04DRAFT_1108803 [Suillus decipiens]|nr:hypothetical protein BDR04DRAFT_1108803 [Suillus decipiens]